MICEQLMQEGRPVVAQDVRTGAIHEADGRGMEDLL